MADFAFSSAGEAIQWAEEISSRPVCDTQFGRLLRRGGAGLAPMEVRDLALTITSLADTYSPPYGRFYRCVMGQATQSLIWEMACLLAQEIQQYDLHQGKDMAQVRRLAAGLIENQRLKCQYDRTLTRARLARIVGISKQAFMRQSWVELEAALRCTIMGWLDIAERGIALELENIGIVS